MANDAALLNFRFFCAATPQSVFAKIMHQGEPSTESSCGVGRAEKKLQILSATVVAAPIRSKLCVSRKRSAFLFPLRVDGLGEREDENWGCTVFGAMKWARIAWNSEEPWRDEPSGCFRRRKIERGLFMTSGGELVVGGW